MRFFRVYNKPFIIPKHEACLRNGMSSLKVLQSSCSNYNKTTAL